MAWGLGIVAVVVTVVTLAAAYDRRVSRRGQRGRSGAAILGEAVHHRVDINAVPYEPARHAGQRDWATYRQRDKRR